MTVATETAPVLHLDCVSVRGQDVDILRDVSWSIARGQHWALLGANGSGKTTLLNMLCAYVHPTTGTFDVLGQRFGRYDWRELRKCIGIVSSSLHARIHGYEDALRTVLSGKAAMLGHWGEQNEVELVRARELLTLVDVPHVADRRWEVLSQGERQRVLIARSLMPQPALLVLDEPCAGLDPVARERFLSLVNRLSSRKEAPTSIFVTHHIEEIVPAISHVLVLKEGSVLAAGPKDRVLGSEVLSEGFGHPVVVRRKGDRYELSIDAAAWGGP
jgi:iron complex transport system ATP-binding protein